VVRDGLEQGGKTAEIMTMLKEFDKKVSRGRGNFYPPAVERLMRQARTWSRRKISRAFEKLAFTDALLKSSRMDKKLILEHLILQLA
jgi:DNA polymerase III delta subunit